MANTFGAFNLVGKEMEAELYLLYEENILGSLDLSSLVPVSVQDIKIMEKELKVSDMECLQHLKHLRPQLDLNGLSPSQN